MRFSGVVDLCVVLGVLVATSRRLLRRTVGVVDSVAPRSSDSVSRRSLRKSSVIS